MEDEVEVPIERLRPRVKAVTDTEVVEPDLGEDDGRANEGMAEGRAGIAGLVTRVGQGDVGRHLRLAHQQLPLRGDLRDQPPDVERAEPVGGAA